VTKPNSTDQAILNRWRSPFHCAHYEADPCAIADTKLRSKRESISLVSFFAILQNDNLISNLEMFATNTIVL